MVMLKIDLREEARAALEALSRSRERLKADRAQASRSSAQAEPVPERLISLSGLSGHQELNSSGTDGR
jgi:phosphoenolpyruvate synthase/pyruvate phosphate dikinase